MAEPATTGKRCKKIEDMQIGDYIVCKYIASNSIVGTFSELGTSTAEEIPLVGSTAPNGTFYFLMVDKSKYGGVLVADRVIQSNIQWFELNVGRVIQGKPQLFDNTKGIIRSLTGGVAYADVNGNRSYNENEGGGIRGEVYGAWPTNNEWEKYIVNFPLEKVQEGKTVDDIFHWSKCATWTQESPFDNRTSRIRRSWKGIRRFNSTSGDQRSLEWGFRPVFEYRK